MTDSIADTDRALLARYLDRAADYHEARKSRVTVAFSTMSTMKALGVHLEAPVSVRDPGELTCDQARRYASRLRGTNG